MTNKDFIINLTDGNNRNINTTTYTFLYKQVGKLCKELQYLLLPTDGYYFRLDKVINLLSLVGVSKDYCVCINTDIVNIFYVFNKEGTYAQFVLCKIINQYILYVFMTQPRLSLSHTIV